MATFAQIKTYMQDALRDQTAITDAQLGRAVNDAIRFYEPERLWFQFADTTITLTVDSDTVPSLPSNFNYDDNTSLAIVDGNDVFRLSKISISEFNRLTNDSSGMPRGYVWIDDALKLAPTPDKAYTLNLRYFKSYDELVTSNQTNDWTIYAPKLLESKAVSYLWLDNQGSPENENEYEVRAARELLQLRKLTNRKRSTGRVRLYASTLPVANYYNTNRAT